MLNDFIFFLYIMILLFLALLIISSLSIMLIFSGFKICSDFITSFNIFLDQSSNIVINLTIILAFIIAIILLFLIVIWIFKDTSLIILPFEVADKEGSYNGKSVSMLLEAEIQTIAEIHDFQYPVVLPKFKSETKSVLSSGFTPIPTAIVQISPPTSGLNSSLLNLGTIGLGTTAISIGQLLITLKRSCPYRASTCIISGSLQNYGSRACLVVTIESERKSRKIESSNDVEIGEFKGMSIPGLIRNLSYKIVFELSRDNFPESMTWLEFKYITEALNNYYLYILNEDMKRLDDAVDKSLRAADSRRNYLGISNLLYNLALIFLNKGDYKEAQKMMQRSLEINESNSDAWNILGLILDELAQNDEAISCYDRAIKINNKNTNALNNKGWSLYLQGKEKYNESIKCFEGALANDKNIPNVWDNKGVVYFAQGRYEDALECYEKAIELDKFKKWAVHNAFYNKANTLVNLKRYDEAVSAYESAIDKDGSFTQAMVSIAGLYRKIAEKKSGSEKKELMKKNKDYCKKAKELIKREIEYNQACYYAICGDSKTSLELLKKALEKKQQTLEYILKDPDLDFIRNELKNFFEHPT